MHRPDCKILVSDYVFGCRVPIKQRCEWQKSNMSLRSWALELKKELYYIGLSLCGRSNKSVT